MIELVEELKHLMKEKDLNPEAAGRFLDCSWRSVYRWTKKGLNPSLISRRKIRTGIEKIRKAYPEEKTPYQLALEARRLYRKIQKKITFQEKEKLFDINLSEGTEAYIERLKELVAQHEPQRVQIQMFKSTDDK